MRDTDPVVEPRQAIENVLRDWLPEVGSTDRQRIAVAVLAALDTARDAVPRPHNEHVCIGCGGLWIAPPNDPRLILDTARDAVPPMRINQPPDLTWDEAGSKPLSEFIDTARDAVPERAHDNCKCTCGVHCEPVPHSIQCSGT